MTILGTKGYAVVVVVINSFLYLFRIVYFSKLQVKESYWKPCPCLKRVTGSIISHL